MCGAEVNDSAEPAATDSCLKHLILKKPKGDSAEYSVTLERSGN